jgi:hypothetical protein
MIPRNIPLLMSQNRPPPASRYIESGSALVNYLVGASMEPPELVGPRLARPCCLGLSPALRGHLPLGP